MLGKYDILSEYLTCFAGTYITCPVFKEIWRCDREQNLVCPRKTRDDESAIRDETVLLTVMFEWCLKKEAPPPPKKWRHNIWVPESEWIWPEWIVECQELLVHWFHWHWKVWKIMFTVHGHFEISDLCNFVWWFHVISLFPSPHLQLVVCT